MALPQDLLGQAYPHGVWFYFPVLFLLKSTLAFLAVVLLALTAAIVAKRRFQTNGIGILEGMELQWRALWVFFLVFLFACLASQLDLSIRHFVIPLVLLILLLSPLPRLLERLRQSGFRLARVCAWLTAALAGASLLTAVRAYPYYLPFLNSLSLGHPGYELVNDSNLDWNQALPEVRQFAERRGIRTLLLDEYGFSDPVGYVPQAGFGTASSHLPPIPANGPWFPPT